jgi:hypothetical protein
MHSCGVNLCCILGKHSRFVPWFVGLWRELNLNTKLDKIVGIPQRASHVGFSATPPGMRTRYQQPHMKTFVICAILAGPENPVGSSATIPVRAHQALVVCSGGKRAQARKD